MTAATIMLETNWESRSEWKGTGGYCDGAVFAHFLRLYILTVVGFWLVRRRERERENERQSGSS